MKEGAAHPLFFCTDLPRGVPGKAFRYNIHYYNTVAKSSPLPERERGCAVLCRQGAAFSRSMLLTPASVTVILNQLSLVPASF